MSYKIAIITTKDVYSGYGDEEYYSKIADSITDWQEVSEEDYVLLHKASGRMGFKIIEQPTDLPKFIAKTIADYKKIVEADNKRLEADKKKREEAALARQIKKQAKDKVSKLKLLKKLQEELGVEQVMKI